MKIEKATAKNKKFKAIFSHEVDGKPKDGKAKMKKIKTTNFGDANAQDYTQHADKKRRTAYRERHQKDLDTKDPMRAGYLSYYILWGPSTNIDTNIKKYKQMFKYK